jgi:hypothetical protein
VRSVERTLASNSPLVRRGGSTTRPTTGPWLTDRSDSPTAAPGAVQFAAGLVAGSAPACSKPPSGLEPPAQARGAAGRRERRRRLRDQAEMKRAWHLGVVRPPGARAPG